MRNYLLMVVVFLAPALVRANSSNGLMDVTPDGKLLLVANTDNGSVSVIDTKEKKVLHEIKVGKKPEGVTWLGAGPRALVTLYGEAALVLVDAASGKVVQKLTVTAEPYGVVANKAGKRVWVTHEYPGKISEIDVDKMQVVRAFQAGSFPRGLALSGDEKQLYAAEFFTGILRAFDVNTGKETASWVGHSTDNICRTLILHPARPKAYLPHIRSMVKVNHGAGSIFPQVSICDLRPGKEPNRMSLAMDTFNGVHVVANPWDAVLSPDNRKLYVIYAGTNDMNVCDVIDDDYQELRPLGVYRTGENPRAIRLSPDGSEVYIYNALDFAVGFYSASMSPRGSVKTCQPPLTPDWVRGKILFNTALPPMTSRRWISCSSCHPDGHHDARTWQQPEGLRKTTALFTMAHTHPLHWSGDRDEAQDFEFTVRSKLMQGQGLMKGPLKPKVGFHKIELEVKTSGQSKDLDALALYCNSLELPLSPHKMTASAERGKKLFFSKETGCASCHSGPYYTDSTLQKPFKAHDVGTGGDDPTDKMGPLYDTPTLLGIYRTAPYLHHGRAKTLHDVFTTFNKNDKHGKTSQLAKQDIDDLVAFLLALPYETPPEVTPNTVPYRVQRKSD